MAESTSSLRSPQTIVPGLRFRNCALPQLVALG